jgi:ribA/ribD-fused uncharacterized protein
MGIREPIYAFRDATEFLSNFYSSPIEYDGTEYPTVEHAFQAAKTLDLNQRAAIQAAPGPSEAKRLGRSADLRPDWEEVKVDIMRELLRVKFSDTTLQEKLLKTGDRVLVEGNTWGDTFWGVCRGKGENHLGLLLMEIRSELQTKVETS